MPVEPQVLQTKYVKGAYLTVALAGSTFYLYGTYWRAAVCGTAFMLPFMARDP